MDTERGARLEQRVPGRVSQKQRGGRKNCIPPFRFIFWRGISRLSFHSEIHAVCVFISKKVNPSALFVEFLSISHPSYLPAMFNEGILQLFNEYLPRALLVKCHWLAENRWGRQHRGCLLNYNRGGRVYIPLRSMHCD